MNLFIERHIANALFEKCPDSRKWQEQLKLSSRVEIPFLELSQTHLNLLLSLYSEPSSNKHALLHAFQLGMTSSVSDQEDIETLLIHTIEFLTTNTQRGWLFRLNNTANLAPWVISRIDFTPSGQEEQARIFIELKANTRGKLSTTQILITERDVDGRHVAQILAAKGFVKETPQLISLFDNTNQKYLEWRSHYGDQFSAEGTGLYAEDPSSNQRNNDWSKKPRIILSTSGKPARVVNDEAILKDRELVLHQGGQCLKPLLKKLERNSPFTFEIDNQIQALSESIAENIFTKIPVHGYVLMFHLDLHHHVWIHVDNLAPYQYQPELKDKLVLPKEQLELIDILTAEMELLVDDIIEGKSGGTTVLCSGPPGVGKTLTAEVYAEIIKRPLYRVHSGQLGLNVMEMEQNLKNILIRAQRWGAVMLIDEADVYIKRRDDNLTMNAVVGVFLRVLEYFNGLLFLTTNRIDDIDEAIISRCIALIRYQAPDEQEREQIWTVMSEQYQLGLSDKLRTDLSKKYSIAGRDIKGLAKLVSRFCQHRNIEPTLEIFEHCAIYRGL